ncbi:hypothetical protein L1987_69395 [Smallanthus sonchifolius]|uniref:Uncharacterized protein n=1 Tax=Smallanthus sonchifolius TaxID=185202 RepID=A0ACB9B563_9ASTR|nr:hypothetical protein L1987_69395 [Smallanthus sonchifolius]
MDSNVLQTSPHFRSFFLGSSKPNLQFVKSSINGPYFSDQSSIPRLKFEANRRLSAVKTATEEIVNPVYVPTPTNRDLRTPHSGYHFDGTTRKFFEGWYFKVSIPEQRQSFCFMYSVENPAFKSNLNTLEQLQYGPRFTGVGAQILGADDKYICQYTNESNNFWGSRHELMLGNTFSVKTGKRPPNSEVPPQFLLVKLGLIVKSVATSTSWLGIWPDCDA